MKLTTSETATKLRTSWQTVKNLARDGVLTDLKDVNPEHKKHYALFSNKEVIALKNAGFRPRLSKANLEQVLAKFKTHVDVPRKRNDRRRTEPTELQPEPYPQFVREEEEDEQPVPVTSIRGAIQRQLDRIEAKVDHLVKLWT